MESCLLVISHQEVYNNTYNNTYNKLMKYYLYLFPLENPLFQYNHYKYNDYLLSIILLLLIFSFYFIFNKHYLQVSMILNQLLLLLSKLKNQSFHFILVRFWLN